MTDKESERDRLDMKSGAKDPIAAPSPQEVRSHPTEGEKLQWGNDATHTDLDQEPPWTPPVDTKQSAET